MALPSFICIGAQKAGTTWLYEMLAQNPSVWLPPLKEVHFFDRLNPKPRIKRQFLQKLESNAEKMERGRLDKGSEGIDRVAFMRGLAQPDVLSEEWYRRLFSHPSSEGRLSGEITPAYLTLPEEAIAYAKSLLPDTKILLLVREPASRNMSNLRMTAKRTKIKKLGDGDWEEIVRTIEKSARGNYSQGIPRWQKHFGPEQLLILPFGRLKTDPVGLIRTIESFIGATPLEKYDSIDEAVHTTKPIEIPDWVAARAKEMAEPQKAYLIEAFGQEFYDQTR